MQCATVCATLSHSQVRTSRVRVAARAYRADMAEQRMSEATAALLDAFADDFGRQLRNIGIVEGLDLREDADGITLTATVLIPPHRFTVTGTGENPVTAYAELTRSAPELMLANAYRNLVETWAEPLARGRLHRRRIGYG